MISIPLAGFQTRRCEPKQLPSLGVTLAAPPNEFRSESPTPTPAVSSPASLNALNEPTSQELPVLASHELPTSPLIPPSSEVTKENSPTLTRLSIPSGQTPSTSSFDPPSGEVDSGTGIQGSIEPRSIRGSGNALVPPTTPTSPLGGTTSEVLPMNRLVASLILRMNDRRASRPRSSSSVQSAQQAAGSFLSSPSLSPAPRIMPRSPLRKTFVAPSPSYL